jgi:hypothetical protein
MQGYMFHLSVLAASLVTLSLGFNANDVSHVVFAQEAEEVAIKAIMEGEPATLRTPEDMEQAEAEQGSMPKFTKPFMPTMDPVEYAREKAAANLEAAKELEADEVEEMESPPPELESPPTLRGINFPGINQTATADIGLNNWPPDTHGAVGPSHFVEVVNFRVVVYDKTGTQRLSRSLRAFFGSSEPLFDPRVVYDRLFDRWVIVATRASTAATDPNQFYFLAASATADPTGAYFIYRIGFRNGQGINNGDWWDFPQLGLQQDAVIVTGNIFDTPTGGFKFAAVTSFPKAGLYNGLGLVFPIFTRLSGTLAPPIVLDNNKDAYLVAASNGRGLHLYRGEDLSNGAEASLTLQAVVDVADYTMPPNAPQCGTNQVLDTADRRFVNASTQVGDSLWNVHTIALGGRARPRFYEIDTEGSGRNTIKQRGVLAASSTSFDFNASIAVNDFSEVFVTWTSTRPRIRFLGIACRNAQVRFSGRQPTDPLGSIPPGFVLFQSLTALTGNLAMGSMTEQRWGDYSAVTLDPEASGTCQAGRRAWLVNETIVNANTWGSQIARIGFCDGIGGLAGLP